MKDKFSFFASYYESFKDLPPEVVGKVVLAMGAYFFEDKETELDGLARPVFTLIRPVLESSKKKAENGAKGGAPEGNSNAKKQAKTSKEQPKNKQKQAEVVFSEEKKIDFEQAKTSDKDKDIGYRNKDIGNIKEKERKRKPSVAESRIGKFRYADEVYMKEQEYNDLIQKYGKEGATWMINKLDSYKKSSGKTYLDDRAAIRTWVEDEYQRHIRQNPRAANNPNPWETAEQDQDALYRKMIGIT